MQAEAFTITVTHKGKPSEYAAELRPAGYSWKIAVFVNEQEIIFEPDEERNLRALIVNEALRKHIDPELVKSIGEALDEAFK